MTTVRTGTLLGWVREVDGAGTVHVEDVYDTDIDDLWAAVTVPARLAGWLGAVDGDLRVGGEFTASFRSSWEGPGRVDVCEVPTGWWSPWSRAHLIRPRSRRAWWPRGTARA